MIRWSRRMCLPVRWRWASASVRATVATRAAGQPLHVRLRNAFLRQAEALAAAGLPGNAILSALAGHGFGEDMLSQVRSVIGETFGTAPMQDTAAAEIVDWMLDAAANEAARALEEGQAGRASDIDVLWVLGLGWPAYDGGPMHRADRAGLTGVVERLRYRQARFGPRLCTGRANRGPGAVGREARRCLMSSGEMSPRR